MTESFFVKDHPESISTAVRREKRGHLLRKKYFRLTVVYTDCIVDRNSYASRDIAIEKAKSLIKLHGEVIGNMRISDSEIGEIYWECTLLR